MKTAKANREVQAFKDLVEKNLARIAEHASGLMPGRSLKDRERVMKHAMALAWIRRADFSPEQGAWITWFHGLLLECRKAPSDLLPLAYGFLFTSSAPPRRRNPTVTVSFGLQRAEINFAGVQMPRGAKDCPPCWRCRYFDGWLPPDEDDLGSDISVDPEVTESCARIDRGKVRVAKWVRDKGWENLEEDT